ncbi:FAD-dependent oxidoreductase [Achromobacter deleyi]|uniref:FAD-dependent oxidoreductase n=1 Tax=Achromobacter deleyi TaxID=1353891 RepID=UPI001492E2C8|nr:GMC oxidoreductase [Achromobacter deleyi]QVQ25627.1 GMC family oxidoreductase [Achromobacter deleyi]UIP21167.1 FAD-dependent oxidoreductase [Achromobacter deleyi]
MNQDFDVVIVGSGPAGVSAAFPLLDAGLRVLMVDGGKTPPVPAPAGQFLDLRQHRRDQSDWMVGSDFHALRHDGAISPKFRTPTQAYVFEDYANVNRIEAESFIAVGSLARGGLSNAWGCGVAKLSADELSDFPFPPQALDASYEAVALRMGVSGAAQDDLSSELGLDQYAQPPVPLDPLQDRLLTRYETRRQALVAAGFRMGRVRSAVLTQAKDGRQACDLSGLCMWGCARRSLYSATEDVRLLQRYAGFSYRPGFIVERVLRDAGYMAVQGDDGNGKQTWRAHRVLLAAGTIASTRFALMAMDKPLTVGMQSCPTAAFLVWVPRVWGRSRSAAFGLGQLAYTLDLGASQCKGYGGLFDTTGIPMAEFSKFMPLGKRFGVDLLSSLLSSCAVSNLFLPGRLTKAALSLRQHDVLHVSGQYDDEVPKLMAQAATHLRAAFRQIGAWVLPRSFTVGRPGSDIHYAASFPMRHRPDPGQTDPWGEVCGVQGLHIVDGASLSSLPAKPHTLTIMANADRIGRHVAAGLVGETRA